MCAVNETKLLILNLFLNFRRFSLISCYARGAYEFANRSCWSGGAFEVTAVRESFYLRMTKEAARERCRSLDGSVREIHLCASKEISNAANYFSTSAFSRPPHFNKIEFSFLINCFRRRRRSCRKKSRLKLIK